MLRSFVAGSPAREAHDALKLAVVAEDAARYCAALWFSEILDRRLFRELGYSTMQQYARVELGFSETRIGDFMRLSRKLDRLPAVKAALPEIGYTKAREIVRVAFEFTPEQHGRWEALWERLRKQGVSGDRAEIVLAALHDAAVNNRLCL